MLLTANVLIHEVIALPDDPKTPDSNIRLAEGHDWSLANPTLHCILSLIYALFECNFLQLRPEFLTLITPLHLSKCRIATISAIAPMLTHLHTKTSINVGKASLVRYVDLLPAKLNGLMFFHLFTTVCIQICVKAH